MLSYGSQYYSRVLKPASQLLARQTRSFFSAPAHHYRRNSIVNMSEKARVLIVGTGGVGTMSAYALEKGGKAEVTAVMRSNYEAVKSNGVNIESIQYGKIEGFRPSKSK